ncbi:hypothetical protein ABZ516_24430, partial [Streptomyces sp. NPDC019826]|uniref:hypothetical protein n=1 Tax=Streptomyces sp. NPDC019826 TaxID=3156667 RepID=UPI0033C8356E
MIIRVGVLVRAVRPLVVAVAFAMAVLAGTEQAAVAFDKTDVVRVPVGEVPDQDWGSAAGRSHRASTGVTDAVATGGRGNAVDAPGELPAEGAVSEPQLEREVTLPAPGQTVEVEMNRPGFDGDIEDPEGCRSWLLPVSTPMNCVSA